MDPEHQKGKINRAKLLGRKQKIKSQIHTQQALHIVYTSSQYALAFKPSKHGIHGVHFEKCPPEYNSLLEGFAPLRPRLKNERKSDIIDNENGRIL